MEENQTPFNIGSFVKESWTLFLRQLSRLLILVGVLNIPIFLLSLFLGINEKAAELQAAGAEATPDAAFVGSMLLVGLLGMLVYYLEVMAIAWMSEKSLGAQEESFGSALKQALSRLFPCLGTGIIAFFILLGLTLLLIVPGIIWGLFYFFIFWAVILRGKSGKDALAYSKSLVQGNWWRIFGMVLLIGLIAGIPGYIVNLIFSMVIGALPEAAVALAVVPFFIQRVLNAFTYVAYTVLFLRLEKLKSPAA